MTFSSGTSDPPTEIVCEGLAARRCILSKLDSDTTYFWRVISRTEAGVRPGPVWSFSTRSEPPGEPVEVSIDLLGEAGDLAFDAPRNRLYVSVPLDNEVLAISLETLEVVRRVPAGSLPRGIDLSHDGSRLFVAIDDAPAIASVDLETFSITRIEVGELFGGSGSYDVVEGRPGRVFVAASTSSGASVAMIKTDEGNEVVRVASDRLIDCRPTFEKSPDRRSLYLAQCPGIVYKLDLEDETAPIVLARRDGIGNVSEWR